VQSPPAFHAPSFNDQDGSHFFTAKPTFLQARHPRGQTSTCPATSRAENVPQQKPAFSSKNIRPYNQVNEEADFLRAEAQRLRPIGILEDWSNSFASI